jgi:putative ABC transport system permease protein
LPPPGLAPLGIGFLTAIAVLGGFALPPLLQLSRTPALRVLRRDVGPAATARHLAFGPAVLAIVFLIFWVLRDVAVFLGFVIGLAVFVLVVAGAGLLLVKLTNRFRGRVGVSWRYGIANLGRRRAESVVQLTAFAHGIMMLLLLAVVRKRSAERLASQPAARHAQLLLHQHSADEDQSSRSSPRARRGSARARCRWSARA